ncbi:penicillin-binding protein 2 [Acinetobacter qingfengensis]|uniref:Peptidoglycan D,D-transpeptidase FtsI n=1 Tax=Acinetobacter qingfengensis TaxID=1262585 RepID=A0A1E7QZ10_9GAMM|nr:penicillin-binding protein 2 [Acinetobacter qingfengensis]KAA8733144.1 penicillin-binding protein 2 [Acinetobacter qingfengensis]OEY92294.1 peptide ABC transporter permease [Acinetobacter qingfengensis]
MVAQKKETKQRKKAVSAKPTLAQDLWRYRVLWTLVALAFLLLVGRAFYIQILDSDFLQQRADRNMTVLEDVPAMRGVISDRNGIPLAISTPMMTVVIDPTDYLEAKARHESALAKLKTDPDNLKLKRDLTTKNLDLNALAKEVGLSPAYLQQEVQKRANSRYFPLKKQVPPPIADDIMAKNFQGVYTEKTYKRFYPQPQPNAQIIGITNSNGDGVEGLEMQLNKRLAGEAGQQKILRDRRGNRLKVEEVLKQGKPGENVTLSIDSRLQYIMYRELTAAGVANNARSATAIAVDVKTGEILAMNSWPSYNPNDPNGLKNKDAMRNRGAIDSFEPGSTMKPFTILMGLESGKFTPETLINTSPGSMRLGNHTIRDTHNYGTLTVGGVLIKSSNIGASKIALSMPYATLPTFYKKIGFGKRSAVGFPGESAGLILSQKRWNISEVATMSYGYGLNATVLQLAQGYAMIANHGVEIPLTLFKRTEPEKGQQMVPVQIADSVLHMLEAVTQPGGTAKEAVIPGYRVGGKTGTAHKLRPDGKGYSQSEYRALFAGVAPISNPRIAMIVVVENPQGKYYGGLVAAPVFARIMQESLRLLNVPLDRPLETPKGAS